MNARLWTRGPVRGERRLEAGRSRMVLPPPAVSVVAPRIGGDAALHSALQSDVGTWTSTTPIAFSYQWQRCPGAAAPCKNIPDATSPTFTPEFFLVRPGEMVTVLVTA